MDSIESTFRKCFDPSCASIKLEYEFGTASLVCVQCGSLQPQTTQFEFLGRSAEITDPTAAIGNGRTQLSVEGFNYLGSISQVAGTNAGSQVREYHRNRQVQTNRDISAMLRHLNLESIYSRTGWIFDTAKRVGKFRWGGTSRIISAACIYVAAREANKQLTLSRLSSTFEIDHHVLARAQRQIKNWTKVKTQDQDPTIYIDQHLLHYSELQKSSAPLLVGSKNKNTWSPKNLEWLRSINLKNVRILATDLASFSQDLSIVLGRKPQSVACALVLMAMEGVARQVVPLAGEILNEMASIYLVTSHTISERIREIYLAIVDYAPRIPWIGDVGGLSKKEIVKHLDDIVTFRSLGEKKEMKGNGKVNFDFEVEETVLDPIDDLQEPILDDQMEDDTEDGTNLFPDPLSVKKSIPNPFDVPPSTDSLYHAPVTKRPAEYMRIEKHKRMKTLESAAATLVTFPFSNSLHSISEASTPTTISPPTESRLRNPVYPAHSNEAVTFRAQLLAGLTPSIVLAGKFEPLDLIDAQFSSRLNKLLWSKKCDDITDEELFEVGEMESFLRNEKELEIIKNSSRFQEMLNHPVSIPRPPRKPKKEMEDDLKTQRERRKREKSGTEEFEEIIPPLRRSSKVDYAKLALALEQDATGEEFMQGLFDEFNN